METIWRQSGDRASHLDLTDSELIFRVVFVLFLFLFLAFHYDTGLVF